MDERLGLLMALRVQGMASAARAAAALAVDDASECLESLVAEGLVELRSGKGYTLTADGRDRLDEFLVADGLRDEPDLRAAYERFLSLNRRVLEVCSAWQVRDVGGVQRPNDHADPDYDAEIIAELEALHDRAKVCLKRLAACAERYVPYGRRLDDCLERLLGGDQSAFTAPMAESYHTVWFELHQDLLLTLGLEREG